MKIHDPLDFYANTSWQLQGPILDAMNNPLNLTNATFSWRLDSIDGGTNFISLTLGNGVYIVDSVNSVVLVDVPRTLTAPISPGSYRDVLVVTTGAGDPLPVYSGIIRVGAALS